MTILRAVAAVAAIGSIAAFVGRGSRPYDDDDALDAVPLGGSAAMIEDEAINGAPERSELSQAGARGAAGPTAL